MTPKAAPPEPIDFDVSGKRPWRTHTVWVRPVEPSGHGPAIQPHWAGLPDECIYACRCYLVSGDYAWVTPGLDDVPGSLDEAKRFCEDPDAIEELRPWVEHQSELAYERAANNLHGSG